MSNNLTIDQLNELVRSISQKNVQDQAVQTDREVDKEYIYFPTFNQYITAIPHGSILNYNFEFEEEFGIASIIWKFTEDEGHGYNLQVTDYPWWATSEYITLEDRSRAYRRGRSPYLSDLPTDPPRIPEFFTEPINPTYRGSDFLPYYHKASVYDFELFLEQQVPDTPGLSARGPPFAHQDPIHIFLDLWDPAALRLQEKFYKIRHFWSLLDDSRNPHQRTEHINGIYISNEDISINQRAHIFLYRLDEFQLHHNIRSDLHFELFWSKYFFEKDFFSIRHDPITRARAPDSLDILQREAKVLYNYLNQLVGWRRIRQNLLAPHNTFGPDVYDPRSRYLVQDLVDYIDSITHIEEAIRRELDSIRLRPDWDNNFNYWH